MENITCFHGCGNKAVHITKRGKYTCNRISAKCPAIRLKNSRAVAKAHQEGTIPGWNDLRINYKIDTGKSNRGKFTRPKSVLISKRGHKCEKCFNEEWLGKSITLELEHIDGNTKNNDESNLLLLCPNCHSQTPTWRRKKTKNQYRKYTTEEYLKAIETSASMNECLRKLDLKWNSGQTVLKIMIEHKVEFMRC
jgi:hypothetical protein